MTDSAGKGFYNPLETEKRILDFWRDKSIYEKAKKKVSGGEKFYFLDGPPYTSGKIHLGHAWNKALKDMVLRYKRLRGFNVYDRAGYDMHGLPTALKVMAKLGIKHKDEIEQFGMAKFIAECKKFALENMKVMNEDFARLGVWMNFENAYTPISRRFIEGEWWLIKKAHEKGRLYKGEKVMHWCSHCSTSLAKHELEYETVRDTSIFVKFRVKGKENEYLVIWTTTPWTIPFNLGVMVNPELEYIRADVEGEIWIVAKQLAGPLIQGVADKSLVVLEEFKGNELDGLEYEHPFADVIGAYGELKKKHSRVHTVVMSSEFVDTSAGSGLVHMAPGCGPEDYEVGRRHRIPPFNTIDEAGVFPEEMGEFAGLVAKKDDDKFIEALDKRGALIAKTQVEHEYAHCWRCKNPVVFRTTEQWFFKIEDLKEKMLDANEKIFWVPEWAGKRQFASWLQNLRDNGITRQRYWGTPVPIWECEKCGEHAVVGSVEELKERGGKEPEDLHRPFIDEVTLKCDKCGSDMRRVPDILDVWIDAGTTSWTALDYPQRKELFEKLWPPDFILEGKDQIRGWFNLLMVASMVSMGKPSFRACYMHGFINDAAGRKMSKSLGNVISPYEVVDRYGADTLRYYMIWGARPGVDINYNFDDMKVKHKNLGVFWNLHRYILDNAKTLGKNPEMIRPKESAFGLEERFMLSRLNSTIKKATEAMESYELPSVPELVEGMLLDLSRKYVQLIRDKLVFGSEDEKEAALWVMYRSFIMGIRMFSIVAPFISEAIYLNMKKSFDLKEESIHLFDWPVADESMIDLPLEEEMNRFEQVQQAILNAREKARLNVRWPVGECVIEAEDELTGRMLEKLGALLEKQTNIKRIRIGKMDEAEITLRPNARSIAQKHGSLTAEIIARIAQESGRAVYEHLRREGKFILKVSGQEAEISGDEVIIERRAPEEWVLSEFPRGVVYLSTVLSKDLEAEGFARELMRRVQQLRKKAGLQKLDRIKLVIEASPELKAMLELHESAIREKVGAEELEFGQVKGLEFVMDAKIRSETLKIGLEKKKITAN